MDIERFIRDLAKKTEQQNLFVAAKDISSIQLFKNSSELSRLQQMYLYYLYFYNDLHSDISLKKVSEKVLDNFIREDSYSYYKRQKNPEKESKKKENDIHLVFNKKKGKNKEVK